MSAVVKKKLFFIHGWLRNFSVRQNKQYIENTVKSQWLIDNKLSLHLGKPESILVGSPQKIKCNPSLEITCNNLAIKSTRSVNYLGDTLDQTLSLAEMAQSLLKKAKARFKFLYRNKQYLIQHTNTL